MYIEPTQIAPKSILNLYEFRSRRRYSRLAKPLARNSLLFGADAPYDSQLDRQNVPLGCADCKCLSNLEVNSKFSHGVRHSSLSGNSYLIHTYALLLGNNTNREILEPVAYKLGDA